MSLLTNNFLLAGVIATLLIVVYYCYVNYLMKKSTNDGSEEEPLEEKPLSVLVVDYGKKFAMFYILGLGLVFVGKKYMGGGDSADTSNSNSTSTGGGLGSSLLNTSSDTGSNVEADSGSSSGSFFSNLFTGGKNEVSNDNLEKLSEVKLKNTKKMENFKTGQPQF